jgi:uncharacterized SAM-binding protein YcdF (DUF218 family)
VLSHLTLAAFNPRLGRNMSADEWAAETLGTFGVSANVIEFVSVEEGFFGTWSEARGVARRVKDRGYRRLILVTSPFHSRRVWESFSHEIGQADARLYMHLSHETVSGPYVLLETLKLLVYRAALL